MPSLKIEHNHCEGWWRIHAGTVKSRTYRTERGMRNAIDHYQRKGYFPGGRKPRKICPQCGQEIKK